jgi:hypothetical protein
VNIVQYRKPTWKTLRKTQKELALDIAYIPTLNPKDLMRLVLETLPPQQFAEIAKHFGYEVQV